MNANELRILNWVNYKMESSEGTVIETVFIDGIKYSNAWFVQVEEKWVDLSNSITPIPLTEEWLFKLGFEDYQTLKGGQYQEGYIGKESVRFTFVLDKPKNMGEWQNEYIFRFKKSGWVHVPIKYVHQLQNLYFALTGEELEIKL